MSILSNLGESRNLGLIIVLVLLIIFSVISLGLIICVLIKALIKLYREHKETEALVRKVWDTEAIAQEDETTADRVPEHVSIVPSLPPIVAHVFPHDKQLFKPYRTSVPSVINVRPCMPAANPDIALPYHQTPCSNQHQWHHHHQPPLFLRLGSEITRSIQQSLPAPSVCSTLPRGLVAEAPDKPDVERKPLTPLSAEELERRRAGCGRRSKRPRTSGKENVAPAYML